MNERLPRTALGLSALEKLNAALLEFKHDHTPLRQLLRPKLVLLYNNTINPKHLAINLFSMNILSSYDFEKIQRLDLDFEKNMYVYDVVFAKSASTELILALEDTRNFRILEGIATLTSAAEDLEKNVPGQTAPVVSNDFRNRDVAPQSSEQNKRDSTSFVYGPKELADLQKKVQRKILQLEIDGSDYPYLEFLEKNQDQYLEKTLNPDDLASILYSVNVLSGQQRDRVKSKQLIREKNKIIYDIIKMKRKLDELIAALGQTSNADMLQLIADTASF